MFSVFAGRAKITMIVVGVVVLISAGLWWANYRASNTQQAVDKQLSQAAESHDKIAAKRESGNNQIGMTTSTSDNNGSADNKPNWRNYEKPSQEKLQEILDPMMYEVTQEGGTEPAHDNELWDEDRTGIYVDALSGEPLFSSKNKYQSGTGWPSFTKPLEPENIVTKPDYLLGYRRTEVRSKYGDNHLGHVFDDGPETRSEAGGAAPTGLRYCLNSAALRFIPKDEMKAAGYGEYLSIFDNSKRKE